MFLRRKSGPPLFRSRLLGRWVAGGRLLPSGSFSIWRGVTGSFSVKRVRISEPGGTCCAVKCFVGLISLPAASGGE